MELLKASISSLRPQLAASLLLAAGCVTGCVTVPSNEATGLSTGPAARAYALAIEASRENGAEDSTAALRAFLQEFPDVAEAHASLGMLYARAGRDDDASNSLLAAISRNPRLSQAHNELGMLHRRAGRFDKARDAYLKALEIDANHANAHRNLGVLYDLYLGKPALALPHYEHYRSLVGADDPMVAKWVTDLKRRIDQHTKTARVNN